MQIKEKIVYVFSEQTKNAFNEDNEGDRVNQEGHMYENLFITNPTFCISASGSPTIVMLALKLDNIRISSYTFFQHKTQYKRCIQTCSLSSITIAF